MLGLLAMGEPARKRETSGEERPVPTFEELWKEIERLPEGVTGEILEPGVLLTKRRPLAKHRRAVGSFMRDLAPADAAIDGKGWWIEREPDVRFGDRLVVPDLVGFRAQKNEETPLESPIVTLPEFCCEVLSMSTARDVRVKKLPLYARVGVEWIWLVDSEYKFVEVYQSVNGFPMLMETAGENDVKRLPPFDIDIDFSHWWLIQTKTEPTTE